jgi:hypothetical protein
LGGCDYTHYDYTNAPPANTFFNYLPAVVREN